MGISSINGRLVSSLTGISANSSSRTKAGSLSGGDSDAVKNSLRLRNTSDTLARAATRLGSAAGYLQVSKDILTKLVDVVDKSISLTEKAARGGTTESSRRTLDRDFKKLRSEFEALRASAKVEGVDLLSAEGLEYVLGLAGLSSEKSAEISALFRDLVTSKGEASLVDPKLKSSKRAAPNPNQPPQPSEDFTRQKISRNLSGADPYQVFATQAGSIFQDDNDPVFNNAEGTPTAIFVDELKNSQAVSNTVGSIELLGVSEMSGYAIAQSSDDIFGYNPAGAMQLYLLASNGNPIMQLSNFEEDLSVESADISSDGLKFAFVTSGDFNRTNGDGSDEVYLGMVPEITQGGLGAVEYIAITDLLAAGNIVSGVKISEDGRYVAYDGRGKMASSGVQLAGYHLYDVEKAILDTSGGKSGKKVIGFFSNENLATYSSTTKEVYSHEALTGLVSLELDTGASSLHAVSEYGDLVYLSEEGDIRQADLSQDSTESSNLIYQNTLADSFYQLSVTNNSDGGLRVVSGGTIVSNDSRTQAYLFEPLVQNVKAQGKRADVVGSVFEYSLRNQANAQRAVEDLKLIARQLKSNISALDKGLEAVELNLNLSLAMSQSFNAVASDAAAVVSAEKIAASVKKMIAQYQLSAEALNQVDNLDEIAAAAVLT